MAYGTMGGEGQPQTQATLLHATPGRGSLGQAIAQPRWLLGRTWGENSTSLKIEEGFAWLFMKRLCRLVMSWSGSLLQQHDGACRSDRGR
jgi:hypothetical protein